MTGTMKAMCRAGAVALLLAVVTTAPAKAQFGGDEDTMAKFAPMLEMMKAKMGKKRFAMLMQTAGPMMSNMMEGGGGGLGGGLGGMLGGGGFGGGLGGIDPAGIGGDLGNFGGGGFGGGDFMSMLGNSGMVAMLPQMMSMIDTGGGSRKVKRKRARR